MYYLQSRYYSPEWGRFINADGNVGLQGDLLSLNVFAYCKNNPVNMADPDGKFAWFLVLFAPEIWAGIVTVATAIMVAAPAIINELSMIASIYGPQITGIVQNSAEKVQGKKDECMGVGQIRHQ